MMAKPERGQGTLYISGGGSSWPVEYVIMEEIRPGRTFVTGTITLKSPPRATLNRLKVGPNEFYLLRLSDDRWVHLLTRAWHHPLDGDVVGEISPPNGYIDDPPLWAEEGGA